MKRVAPYVLLPVVTALCLAIQSGCSTPPAPSTASVDPAKLRDHVVKLSTEFHPRSFTYTANLARCASYIGARFAAAGAVVSTQEYVVMARTYQNVIGRFDSGGPRIVVGAHYDACGDTPGADDNASGVSGLLELAGLIGKGGVTGDVELVAYANEEPPFFGTADMGSAHHASSLRAAGVDVKVAIALEMLGCFSDDRGSQRYPSAILHLFYPSRGNFIGVVGRPEDRVFVNRVSEAMTWATDLDVRSAAVARDVAGVDFSDHRSYWDAGYNAVMVTDTAFYRNPDYHGPGDTAEKLDYPRMSKVVIGVYEAVKGLANDVP